MLRPGGSRVQEEPRCHLKATRRAWRSLQTVNSTSTRCTIYYMTDTATVSDTKRLDYTAVKPSLVKDSINIDRAAARSFIISDSFRSFSNSACRSKLRRVLKADLVGWCTRLNPSDERISSSVYTVVAIREEMLARSGVGIVFVFLLNVRVERAAKRQAA